MPSKNRNFLDPSSPFYLCWQPGFLEWLESWQPQVLIVEANPRYLSTPSAIRWMHARGRPVLGWGLGAPPLSGALADWRSWERKRFLDRLDGVIAYSKRGAAEYRAMGMPAERIFWAPNAVALKPAGPSPERPTSFAGKPVVLFVGRLQSRKRIDLLLQACAALPVELQPRLVIVGDGPDRAEMEAQAKQAYPSAEFPGARYGDELAAYFKQADLFVLPGTGGLAVQQALGYALPVIVAQGDGTQEDLVRPDNGWLIPPDDLQALLQAMQEALSDVARLRQMGARGFRIVSEEVNLDTMVAAFIFAAERVLELGLRQP
jgi:glycosyltransferase involved in cell wall biosynthesis